MISSFTSIGFIIAIDNVFTKYAPSDIKKSAANTLMIFGRDQNTFSKIFKRYRRKKHEKEPLSDLIASLVINCG